MHSHCYKCVRKLLFSALGIRVHLWAEGFAAKTKKKKQEMVSIRRRKSMAAAEAAKAEKELEQVNQAINSKTSKFSSIAEFWLFAFLSNHFLGNLLTEEDQKILMYLDSLQVEDFKDNRNGYSITFNFRANPYFENASLSKTIEFVGGRSRKSIGTTIKWKEGMAPANGSKEEKIGNKRRRPFESFFSWFGYPPEDAAVVDQDEVASTIKYEIWLNPLKYLNDEDDEEDSGDDENFKQAQSLL